MSFGPEYARLYEAKYATKEYGLECDRLLELLRNPLFGSIKKILDLGCGSGGHAFELAKRGFSVHAVDRSASMIDRALSKSESKESPIFLVGDATDLDLGQEFDVVIMMFAVMSYLVSNDDVLAAFNSVQRHLRPGGLFLADFWYGPGVLSESPQERSSSFAVDGAITHTRVRPSLELDRDVCRLEYQISQDGKDQVTIEIHEIRYFFIPEIEQTLQATGLKLLRTFDGSDWSRPLDGVIWTAGFMAMKV